MAIHSPIFQPVIALVSWTMLMWCWMYATRLPEILKPKYNANSMVGTIGSNMDGILPAKVQWKAHNYNHLLAEPTLFYVVCIVLALEGAGDGLNLQVAWVYVGLRVVHSLFQATINLVVVRFFFFMLSSIALMFLAQSAARIVFEIEI